jgi:hypothetical protein
VISSRPEARHAAEIRARMAESAFARLLDPTVSVDGRQKLVVLAGGGAT